jgi:hypothetical protein
MNLNDDRLSKFVLILLVLFYVIFLSLPRIMLLSLTFKISFITTFVGNVYIYDSLLLIKISNTVFLFFVPDPLTKIYLCSKRTLASMGTHDLDTIQGPFTYEALPHKEIKFVPLNKDVEVDGDELMELYAVSH